MGAFPKPSVNRLAWPPRFENRPVTNNPDPFNWRVEQFAYDDNNRWLVLLVRYPGCTNFEGRKILVFREVTMKQLVDQGPLDPHFTDDPKVLAPVARFEPTERGWAWAMNFVKQNNF